MQALDDHGQKTAQNQEIPVLDSKEAEFFDFDESEVRDFDVAFAIDEEDQKGDSKAVAQADKFVDDEWEDEELTLAWEDEQEEEGYNFKVVNFDLNKNSIREDQKAAVKENVKLAVNAAKEGKKLVVAGHCCELGSASFNMSLSEKRAKAIRDEMVKGGVPEGNITIVGCGCEHQIVTSDAEDRVQRINDLAANRRAEISRH